MVEPVPVLTTTLANKTSPVCVVDGRLIVSDVAPLVVAVAVSRKVGMAAPLPVVVPFNNSVEGVTLVCDGCAIRYSRHVTVGTVISHG